MGDPKNIAIPYGSLPGESTEDRVRIPEEKWRVLRSTPDFKAYWNCERADDACVYKLTVAAYIRGFAEREVRTMLSIWHDKHRKAFDSEEWVRYVRPNALKKAKEYAEKRGQTVSADTEELHWIVNHEGEVVRRDVGSILPRCFSECQHWQGVGYRNGRKTDCRLENLTEVRPGEVKVPLW